MRRRRAGFAHRPGIPIAHRSRILLRRLDPRSRIQRPQHPPSPAEFLGGHRLRSSRPPPPRFPRARHGFHSRRGLSLCAFVNPRAIFSRPESGHHFSGRSIALNATSAEPVDSLRSRSRIVRYLFDLLRSQEFRWFLVEPAIFMEEGAMGISRIRCRRRGISKDRGLADRSAFLASQCRS